MIVMPLLLVDVLFRVFRNYYLSIKQLSRGLTPVISKKWDYQNIKTLFNCFAIDHFCEVSYYHSEPLLRTDIHDVSRD